MRSKVFAPLLALVVSVTMILGESLPGEARTAGPKVEARAYCFRQVGTGLVLAARNMHEVRSIASLSKMMAALVFMDRGLRLDGITVLRAIDMKTARGGARTRLRTGARYRNRDLLYAALLASDNAAISALGRAVGLTPGKLTEAMNRRARAMGLRHTHFEDPVGIDHGNVSTAWEVTSILQAVMRHPVLHRVTTTPEHYLRAVWPRRHHVNYLNTDLFLFRRRFRVLAGKTGFNSAAGYCLAAAVRARGWSRPVLGVVLGARRKLSRFSDFSRIAATLPRSVFSRMSGRLPPGGRRRTRHGRAQVRGGLLHGPAAGRGHGRHAVTASRFRRSAGRRGGPVRARKAAGRTVTGRRRRRGLGNAGKTRVALRSRRRPLRGRGPGRRMRLPSGSTLAEGRSD